MPDISNILTMLFDDKSIVTMQTHPTSLTSTLRSGSVTTRGISNIITYVPSGDTSNSTVNISGFFSAILPAKVEDAFLSLAAGAGAITGALSLSLLNQEVLDVISAGTNTISLAQGAIDLTAGAIVGNTLKASPVGITVDDSIKQIKKLSDALKNGRPCEINWDVDIALHKGQRYIISNLNVSAQRIQHETGNTLEISVGIQLNKFGVGVGVE